MLTKRGSEKQTTKDAFGHIVIINVNTEHGKIYEGYLKREHRNEARKKEICLMASEKKEKTERP
jgi:hypothetical protein